MSDEGIKKPKLELVSEEELDEEEREFRAIRRDLPGVKGASAVGIVTINVSKTPGKNEFFRTHADFRPIVPMVDCEVGMDRHYFAVTDPMIEALAGIGINVTNHTLYLTVTPRGAVRIVPIRHPDAEGNQNEYHRTKEIGLIDGVDRWVRLYRPGKSQLHGFSRARGPVSKSDLAGVETGEAFPARVQGQRTAA
jgi:hypothetical protein